MQFRDKDLGIQPQPTRFILVKNESSIINVLKLDTCNQRPYTLCKENPELQELYIVYKENNTKYRDHQINPPDAGLAR